MPAYDATHFDPPAPVAQVLLRNPDGGAAVGDVPLLVDSGADVTLLPRAAVERLGIAAAGGQYELVGFDGSRSLAPSAVVELVLLRWTFRGQYLLIDDERCVLGRNVLNHLAVLLDGPRGQWSPHPP